MHSKLVKIIFSFLQGFILLLLISLIVNLTLKGLSYYLIDALKVTSEAQIVFLNKLVSSAISFFGASYYLAQKVNYRVALIFPTLIWLFVIILILMSFTTKPSIMPSINFNDLVIIINSYIFTFIGAFVAKKNISTDSSD